MKFIVTALSITVLSGCGMPPSTEPPPVSVDFVSAVQVTPSMTTPGRRVSFNVDVTNVGNLGILADVELHVVSDSGKEIWDQTWTSVKFGPKENWNLNQNFLPATNADFAPYKVRLVIRGQEDGAVYYDEPRAGAFQISSSMPAADGGVSK